jgi:RimJ/RimL family protein N-acetyltransferase
LDHIRFNDRDDGHAIANVAGTAFNPNRDVSICRVVDDVPYGGVIFSNYTEESIAMHSGGFRQNWTNRDILFVMFDYPFRQLQVNRIFGYVPADNEHAIRINENLGFVHVARLEGMFRNNTACLLMKMEKTACRFLNIKPRTLRPNYH